jgi:choline dehydrogenase-like flavoprotein
MLIDARSLPGDVSLYSDVCVIGGGIAGITLALELEKRGVSTVVLEAGGRRFSSRSQSEYAGDAVGLSYDLAASRTRQLGGSSNCWWGWCSPFSRMDFEKRPWVPNSGWPIGSADLAPYYPAAAKALEIDGFGEQHKSPYSIEAFISNGLTTWISHLSPPTRFGRRHHNALKRSSGIRMLLNAPVTEILTSNPPGEVSGARIASGGRQFDVNAKAVVLAAGGIENPRLLLLSNTVESAGIGNRHDNVGRYFMDHPRIRAGRVVMNDPASIRRLYDVRYYHGNGSFASERFCGSIGLTEGVQQRDELLQCWSGFMASYVGEQVPGVDIAKSVYKAVTRANAAGLSPKYIGTALSALPAATLAYVASLTRATSLVRHFQVQSVLEPVPDRNNRVTLSEKRDSLGLNRTCLEWRVGALEKRTHLAALHAIKHAIEAPGLGRVEYGEEELGAGWDTSVLPTNHHMGTTRMSEDPRSGVVDLDCRVHGYGNLFVAGSSVFPTGAGQPPTFTIVALTLRLADTLVKSLR